MKKLLTTLVVGLILGWAGTAAATCDISSAFTTGQTLTAAQLNTLVTDAEACTNNVLNGDTFTGNIAMHSGTDVLLYSDTGSTVTASIDGATGNIVQNSGATTSWYSDVATTLKASISGATGKIMGYLLSPGTYNLDIVITANVLTIRCGGADCSATNPGFVVMASTTAGALKAYFITANQTLQDAGHGTPQILGRWGTTASVAWGSAMPVYIGATEDQTAGTTVRFFLTRNPAMTTTPSSTNNIGIGGTAPSTSAQGNIVLFGTAANTSYNSKAATILGSVQMTIDNSAGGSATIGALTAGRDGFGLFQAGEFTLPPGQNGADSGKTYTATASTSLAFSGAIDTATYYINKTGQVTLNHSHIDQSANGAGGTPLRLTAPYAAAGTASMQYGGGGRCTIGGNAGILNFVMIVGNTYAAASYVINGGTAGGLNDNSFSNTSDYFVGTIVYQAF